MTPADLQGPAELIGFRHLEETVAAYDRGSHAATEGHEAFLRDLTARIDQSARAEDAAQGMDAEDRPR